MVKNIIVFVFLILIFISCSKPKATANFESNKNKNIILAYVFWAGETAATNVLKVVFEKLGYNVNILSVTAAIMYQYVATGKVDGMVCAWVPTADRFYYEKLKDKFVDLGPNYEGTKQGFVVPSYVPINSIADLRGHGRNFGNKMIGIDAGAGTQLITEETLKHYELEKEYELVSSSEAAMLSSLDSAIKRKKWILVPLWMPHWAFSRYNIKFLEDYDFSMGANETVNTLVRLKFDDDDPDAYYVLDHFNWSNSHILPLIDQNENDPGKEYEHALEFVKNNNELVKTWVPEYYHELFD